MRDVPSVRRLWKPYKQRMMEWPDIDRRDLIFAQGAFYAGVRVSWKILGYLVEDGEPEELERLIQETRAPGICDSGTRAAETAALKLMRKRRISSKIVRDAG